MMFPPAHTLDQIFETLFESLGEELPGACRGGYSHFHAALRDHGIHEDHALELTIEAMSHGGYCDCEVILKAAERMIANRTALATVGADPN